MWKDMWCRDGMHAIAPYSMLRYAFNQNGRGGGKEGKVRVVVCLSVIWEDFILCVQIFFFIFQITTSTNTLKHCKFLSSEVLCVDFPGHLSSVSSAPPSVDTPCLQSRLGTGETRCSLYSLKKKPSIFESSRHEEHKGEIKPQKTTARMEKGRPSRAVPFRRAKSPAAP